MVAIAAVIFLCGIAVFVIVLLIIYRYARKYLNGDYTQVSTDEEIGHDCQKDDTYTEQRLHPFEDQSKEILVAEKERKPSTESLDTKSFRENILEETKKYSELGAYYRAKYPKASSTPSPVSARSLTSQKRSQSQSNISSLSKTVPLRKSLSSEDVSKSPDKQITFMQTVELDTPQSTSQNKEEPIQTVSTSDSLLQKAQAYYQYTEENISEKIKARGFENEFASDAVLFCAIHYYETSKILFVNIQRIEGLYFLDRNCPQEINFHFKIIPKNRFHSKTRWKPVSSKVLSLSHSMGPLTIFDMQKSTLLIRLYGRQKKAFGKKKCYGEAVIILNDFLGKEEEVVVEKKILPKAGKTIHSSSEDLLSD